MESVKDYPDVEFICIDDNSKEEGTQEYLQTLEDRGWKVINQEDYRDSSKQAIGKIKHVIDEFSSALNIFLEESTGEIIAPLQGDMQFIRKGWLKEYISLFEEREDVFAIMMDAQRKIRVDNSSFEKIQTSQATFAVQDGRNIPGAGDCFYRKNLVEAIGGWHIGKELDAENIFTVMGKEVFYNQKKTYVPWIPVSIAIYTDPRGTNGRVRGNKRYGLYWEATQDNLYYKWVDQEKLENNQLLDRPFAIEDIVVANGDWQLPIDENGHWKKNPINWPLEEHVAFETIY
jgi:glycosyltransferase involved in cell wall biosynthesis